ncbi:MAG: glycosyltransferase family 4 protein [Patescibacteria group bacterium]|nr:glycosyltransferase family 4 protein [Patescibacteria group bacterium]
MKKVLLVSIGFSPNIGGIETHFDDLIKEVHKKGIKINVITYMPLTTNTRAYFFEKRKDCAIIRLPIFRGFFYRFKNNPFLEFVYLTPLLFLFLPIFLLFNFRSIGVIHSHGLVAGFVCVFWGLVFRLPVITTTHSIYLFPKKGLYRFIAKHIFAFSSKVLCLSLQSAREIEDLGISPNKITVFTYWINTDLFSPVKKAKEKTGWDSFTVLFVGRLVPEKGVKVLLNSKKIWSKKIKLAIIGIGPLDSLVFQQAKKDKNLIYLGAVSQSDLPLYYSAADLLIVPSIHEEGFGRVILESLSCGTPVLASNRGAIPEAISEKVGELIEINEKSIKEKVEELFDKNSKIKIYQKNARKYALEKFSSRNAQKIINVYLDLMQ